MSAIRGRLITAAFTREVLPQMKEADEPPAQFCRSLESWSERVEASTGPASSVRAIADTCVLPLLRILELAVTHSRALDRGLVFQTSWGAMRGPDVLVVPWHDSLAHAWRTAVHSAIASDGRWALCSNGSSLRIVDARRTWSRDYLELDLAQLPHEPDARRVAWNLLRGGALASEPPRLDEAVVLSAQHGIDVCTALGAGVMDALRLLVGACRARSGHLSQESRRRRGAGSRGAAATTVDLPRAFEHSVTLLYRLLFLLFAEARSLVPMWHPVYRDRYSLEAIVGALLDNRPYRGLWPSIRAISNLAQTGCAAGDLKVNAFNGRLFAPSGTATLDSRAIPDAIAAAAVAAVSTRRTPSGVRNRILFRDLDVEQLGAIYEQVLEHEPSDASEVLTRTRDVRKASGTFYTPRAITAHLIQHTLGPLVDGRSADDILRLRVLDPAMGSGAFLVAACRYLSAKAEDALIREGHWHPGDVSANDRISLRRRIAQRCLYGVDLNPVAVHLARLSLWLTTLARDKPLSFLDHHLVVGDSLVGAGPLDLVQRPLTTPGRRPSPRDLPLFVGDEATATLERAVRTREAMAADPDDTVDVVRTKERTLAALQGSGSDLSRWVRMADLWCSGWFRSGGKAPDRALLAALGDAVLHDRFALPRSTLSPLLADAEAIAARHRFVHWPLTFPEVFADAEGRALPAAGFDAIVGNPPWDVLRGDSGAGHVRGTRRDGARQLTAFARESGVYRLSAHSHLNRYQLFVERSLQLIRPGGRIGLVLPAGIANDAGSAPLRSHLFERTAVDRITGFHNRAGIFPIHRSIKFVLLTASAGRPTTSVSCRFGLSSPAELEGDEGATTSPVILTRQLLSRLSGPDDLALPEICSAVDLRILERVAHHVPSLGHADGWNVRFGRELNASDDRAIFRPRSVSGHQRPVVEGKHIEPFRARLERCELELRAGADVGRRVAERPRLAYRDVAGATNRLTLIAAIIPAHAVTTHTAFCAKTPLGEDEMLVLCALLNSFVANYLVRMRVSTHVTATLMSQLPVPLVNEEHPAFDTIASLGGMLASSHEALEDMPEYAHLQAIVGDLYGLTRDEFVHVLGTFPLVGARVKAESLAVFEALHRHGPQRRRGTESSR